MPLGRLRESRFNVHRAHLLVYTNCPPKLTPMDRRILTKEVGVLPYQHLSFTTVEYEDIKPIFGNSKKMNYEKMKDCNVLAVTGIAHPENFVEMLMQKSRGVVHLPFSDHHNFSAADIAKISKAFAEISGPKMIVVTEKDAVRLRTSKFIDDGMKPYMFYVPIRVELLCDDEEKKQFNNQIISYVRNNKRYNKLYNNSL
ncbi:MAG: tetraacyldisaccharide 4'-kinase, partial [Bacteroidales bacterium]|nr:tetraacyldisaccharide 4'-kinase [Bacteroidales bacterium]